MGLPRVSEPHSFHFNDVFVADIADFRRSVGVHVHDEPDPEHVLAAESAVRLVNNECALDGFAGAATRFSLSLLLTCWNETLPFFGACVTFIFGIVPLSHSGP